MPYRALPWDFTTQQISLLGSAHFFGFLIGCWWAPRVMGKVGHSRAFAAFTATGAIGLLAHMLVLDPYAWAAMRIASGLCIASCYTVVEAWMHAKVINSTRGRAMATYHIVDLVARWARNCLSTFCPQQAMFPIISWRCYTEPL